MSDIPQPDSLLAIDRPTFVSAEQVEAFLSEHIWSHINTYDNAASESKRNFLRFRLMIILLTFATTLFEVIGALTDLDIIARGALVLGGAVGLALCINMLVRIRAMPLATLPIFGALREVKNNWAIRLLGIVMAAAFFAAAAILWEINYGFPIITAAEATEEGKSLGDAIGVINMLLIALPLLSAGLLAYASRFESATAWIGYRIATEHIRRAVYEFRVRCNFVAREEDLLAELEDLQQSVGQARAYIDQIGVTTPTQMRIDQMDKDDKQRVKPLYTGDAKDDGYRSLSVKEYTAWRVMPQLGWYRRRVAYSYRKTRLYRILLLVLGGVGSFLAATGLGIFVAITVAGSTALLTWLSLMQYESTYQLQWQTISILDNQLSSLALHAAETPEEVTTFVAMIEDTLEEEREEWRRALLYSLAATDEEMAEALRAQSPGEGSYDFVAMAGADDELLQGFGVSITEAEEIEAAEEEEKVEAAEPAEEDDDTEGDAADPATPVDPEADPTL